ncbi:MAG TPA: glycosyltransferase family 39 protein [Syntrophorhabdus sp.]|nr:glycosyltransferase family 39 protein [Syntrophorhabdus sp.]
MFMHSQKLKDISSLTWFDVGISVFIIIFGLCFFFKSGVETTGDSALYAAKGLKIFLYNTYDFYQRGPVFPLLIALSYKLFGISIESAFFVVRFFLIMCWVLIYWLALSLYSRQVAVASVALIVTSYGMNLIGEYLLPDTIVPFFILSFLLVLMLAFRRMNNYLFAMAGLMLGFSVLVKEVALLFLPVPIIIALCIPAYWRWSTIIRIVLFYLIMVGPLLVWVQFLGHNNASASNIVSMGGEAYSGELLPSIQSQNFSWMGYMEGLWVKVRFIYQEHILTTSRYLGPFFLLAWVVIGIRGITSRNLSDWVLIAAFICSFPLVIALGGMQTRIGQLGFLIVFSYIVMAEVLAFFIKKMAESNLLHAIFPKYRSHPFEFLFGGTILILILVQLFIKPNSTITIYKGTYQSKAYKNVSLFYDRFEVKGRHAQQINDACLWLLKDNSNTFSYTIMLSEPLINGVDFYTRFLFKNVPIIFDRQDKELYDDIKNSDKFRENKLIFIYSHPNFGSTIKRYNYVAFVFEEDISRLLMEHAPKYVLISDYEAFLKLYFDQAPYAKRVYDNEMVTIYKIDPELVSPLKGFNMVVSDIYKDKYNTSFKDNFPENYERVEKILSYFDLSQKDLNSSCYYSRQLSWALEKIDDKTNRIACIEPIFMPDEKKRSSFRLTEIREDMPSNVLKEKFDYLVVRGDREDLPKKYNGAHSLIDKKEPLWIFPTIYKFGKGVLVYSLN